MRREVKAVLVTLLSAVVLVACGVAAQAQSGTRGTTPPESTPTAEKTSKEAVPVLDGRCPVCIAELGKWVQGKPEFQTVFDGRTYLFPGAKQKKMFLADPAKYVPALGGDCVVCLTKAAERVLGNIQYHTFYKQRLYLFPSDEQKEAFDEEPDIYADADLAFDGNCAVCRVDMDTQTPGKPEFMAHHDGFRYFFPSDKMREMFLADPEKYAVEQPGREHEDTPPAVIAP